MISFITTAQEMMESISKRAQAKRLSINLSQKSLSERSGVSFGVVKKFERTGRISLESLLKIALVLDSLKDFKELFEIQEVNQFISLEELIKQKPRKRGRK